MKILSIHDGHNASASLFENGQIISCVSEERINRIKFYSGWPELSIKYVLESNNVSLDQIDVVTLSHLNTLHYVWRKLSFLENYEFWPIKRFLGHLYHIFLTFKREIRVRNLFRDIKKKPKFYFCDHHLGHAASAYYYSGFDSALVVTIDAQGDVLSHTAYQVNCGLPWKMIVRGGGNESLGAFYAAITEALGFKPNRHEGKIVGLAAMGNHNNILDRITDHNRLVKILKNDLHFKRKGYYEIIGIIKELLDNGCSREDIAAYGQYLLEDLVIKHIKRLCEIAPNSSIALAGGVFSNVKLNQKIIEQCPLDRIFVQPGMGDEGIVLGSAAFYLDHYCGIKISSPMSHVYYGNEYNNEYVENLLKINDYRFEIPNDISKTVAELIFNGKIIGWFDGKMEFGPRALGHRTMIADPREREINNTLNKRLQRSEFMPFAPSVLFEMAEEVFENIEPAKHAAEFMTITFNVKKKWIDNIKAVVHVDDTARPQLVREEVNPHYYRLIKEFYKLSGIPLFVNTSFNMHEEPIVCSPEDALRSFEQGAVDYIVFNHKYLVSKL